MLTPLPPETLRSLSPPQDHRPGTPSRDPRTRPGPVTARPPSARPGPARARPGSRHARTGPAKRGEPSGCLAGTTSAGRTVYPGGARVPSRQRPSRPAAGRPVAGPKGTGPTRHPAGGSHRGRRWRLTPVCSAAPSNAASTGPDNAARHCPTRRHPRPRTRERPRRSGSSCSFSPPGIPRPKHPRCSVSPPSARRSAAAVFGDPDRETPRQPRTLYRHCRTRTVLGRTARRDPPARAHEARGPQTRTRDT